PSVVGPRRLPIRARDCAAPVMGMGLFVPRHLFSERQVPTEGGRHDLECTTLLDMQHHHKKIRLPLESYNVPGLTWLVTIATIDRAKAFHDPNLADMVANQLVSYSAAYELSLHAWCVMPDHLHLVVQIGDKGLVPMINAFKSRTTTLSWSMGRNGKLWQASFHDHGLREVEDGGAAVTYLYRNPERAGLADSDGYYRWRGGLAFDSDQPESGAQIPVLKVPRL
ncbi:MAG TPA: transposase, partial [Thermomicrobiales bacterium]|nr:transposase [Thermomicrobiales bacterium]